MADAMPMADARRGGTGRCRCVTSVYSHASIDVCGAGARSLAHPGWGVGALAEPEAYLCFDVNIQY